MAFPQTTATEATRNGQQVWRLFGALESSGDLYESELSARAIVIGPDSDIARAQVTYYDVQNVNQAENVTVSVEKPYIGRLDALASRTYQTSDRARLLYSPLDLAPPAGFRPPSAGAGDVVEIIVPNIDVLSYLTEVPTYIEPRANKQFLLEQLPSVTGGVPQWFMIPFYGRRIARVGIKSLGFLLQPAVTVNIYGINFSNILPTPSLADNGHQQELLATAAIPAPGLGAGISESRTVTTPFDYLAIEVTNTGGGGFPSGDSVSTNVFMSDQT